MTIARESTMSNTDTNRAPAGYSIDEIDLDNLAWFSFESSTRTPWCHQSLKMAAELMAPGAWAVVQINRTMDPAWLENEGLKIVETYENQAPAEDTLHIYLTRKVV